MKIFKWRRKMLQKNYYHKKRKRERKLRLNFLIPYYVKTITHSKEQLVVNQGIFEREDDTEQGSNAWNFASADIKEQSLLANWIKLDFRIQGTVPKLCDFNFSNTRVSTLVFQNLFPVMCRMYRDNLGSLLDSFSKGYENLKNHTKRNSPDVGCLLSDPRQMMKLQQLN